MKVLNSTDLKLISKELEALGTTNGFEYHPFKIGWYNDAVGQKFCLPHHDDTLAFVAISTPSMFERTFLPFVKHSFGGQNEGLGEVCSRDPLDQSMIDYFQSLILKMGNKFGPISKIHDFELGPSRRPKVLVQTAGHVSGAVRFYQKQDCQAVEESFKNKKVYPVCLHPKFGGWFALRGILIFSECLVPDLPQKIPPRILKDSEVENLLTLYNFHWKDWRFRDVIEVDERYSENQKRYFDLAPGNERWKYLKSLLT